MNQLFNYLLTEELNEKHYTLSLPVGAPWSDAIQVSKAFADAVAQLAQDAEKQAQERAAQQEPVEATAEPVSEGN